MLMTEESDWPHGLCVWMTIYENSEEQHPICLHSAFASCQMWARFGTNRVLTRHKFNTVLKMLTRLITSALSSRSLAVAIFLLMRLSDTW